MKGMLRGAFLFGVSLCACAAQDFDHMQIEHFVGGMRFAEGPVFTRDGLLIFSDIPTSRILQARPGEKLSVYREDAHGATGNTLDAQGRLYTCESQARRVTRTDKKGNVETLAERWEGKRLNSPNDIVVRHDGNVYFTDPAFGKSSESRELDFYGVFRITPKGVLEVLAKPKGRPNGIALSANGKTLFVANSDEKNVRAYDLDGKGLASNERVVISGISGVPDGLRADEKGNLYVACKGLAVYSPDFKLLRMFELSEKPSNCTFGDPDFETLYITARTSVYRIRLGVKGAIAY
jgi:gluconolactonase